MQRKRSFTSPTCTYCGLFQDVRPESGLWQWARCPRCGSLERHRLQSAVVDPRPGSIQLDMKALSEVHRVLKPGGLASCPLHRPADGDRHVDAVPVAVTR